MTDDQYNGIVAALTQIQQNQVDLHALLCWQMFLVGAVVVYVAIAALRRF